MAMKEISLKIRTFFKIIALMHTIGKELPENSDELIAL